MPCETGSTEYQPETTFRSLLVRETLLLQTSYKAQTHGWWTKLSNTMVVWSFTNSSPQKHVVIIENRTLWADVRCGCVFRKCILPEGLAKELQNFKESPNVWISSVIYRGCTHFDMQIRCKNIPDAFNHVPDLFWRAPGPGNRV